MGEECSGTSFINQKYFFSAYMNLERAVGKIVKLESSLKSSKWNSIEWSWKVRAEVGFPTFRFFQLCPQHFNDVTNITSNFISIMSSFLLKFQTVKKFFVTFLIVKNWIYFDRLLHWQAVVFVIQVSTLMLILTVGRQAAAHCSNQHVSSIAIHRVFSYLTVKRYNRHFNIGLTLKWLDSIIFCGFRKWSLVCHDQPGPITPSPNPPSFTNINELGLTGVLGDLQQRTCANPNMLLEEIEFKKVK